MGTYLAPTTTKGYVEKTLNLDASGSRAQTKKAASKIPGPLAGDSLDVAAGLAAGPFFDGGIRGFQIGARAVTELEQEVKNPFGTV